MVHGQSRPAVTGHPLGCPDCPDQGAEPIPPEQQLSPQRLLRGWGRGARKRLSQSFLVDPRIAAAIAEAAELSASDSVLEIGPGLGVLTRELLSRAGAVVAVELDRELAFRLPALAPGKQLVVVNGDALTFDPAEHLPGTYKLVANLPYHISSPLLARYLFEVKSPDLLVVMLQRELAERIAAPQGQSSSLATVIQAVATVEVVRRVPAGAFYPRPRVESAVLRLRRRPDQLADAGTGPFQSLVRAGYAQPRKTLANSLAQGLGRPRSEVEALLERAQLDPRARPQTVSVADWQRLLTVMKSAQ